MDLRKTILSLTLVLTVISGTVIAHEVTGEVGVGASPGNTDPTICVDYRNLNIGVNYAEGGISVNGLDLRSGLYMFTGEQLEYKVVVRDPNGALDIGPTKIRIGNGAEVLCNEIQVQCEGESCQPSCDGLGYFNPLTDKYFHCLVTAEPQHEGEQEVKITAYDSTFEATDGTHIETWFFNPALSMSVTTSDDQPINFEEGLPGEWVHSLNRLEVKNLGEGGVNLWVYLASSDLYDPNGASKCPNTNKLDVEGVSGQSDTGLWFRGWSGTQWQSGEGWQHIKNYDQNDGCDTVLSGTGTNNNECYGGQAVPNAAPSSSNPSWTSNLLTNQGRLEVEFKLKYPQPCVGTFSQGTLYVIGKAV